jgi:hypothetical protein
MTPADRRHLQAYCLSLRDRLGLRDWQIEVSPKPPTHDEWVAECFCPGGLRLAIVRFRDDFRQYTAHFQRATVVHELLHAVFSQTQDLVRDVLPNAMDEETHALFREAWFRQHELAIDTLAEALAPAMPPIRWPA